MPEFTTQESSTGTADAALVHVGLALRKKRKYGAARQLLSDLVGRMRYRYDEIDRHLLLAQFALADSEWHTGEVLEAQRSLCEVVGKMEIGLGETDPWTQRAKRLLKQVDRVASVITLAPTGAEQVLHSYFESDLEYAIFKRDHQVQVGVGRYLDSGGSDVVVKRPILGIPRFIQYAPEGTTYSDDPAFSFVLYQVFPARLDDYGELILKTNRQGATRTRFRSD